MNLMNSVLAMDMDHLRYGADHGVMRTSVAPAEYACSDAVAQFRSHSLAEQASVDLMDRTDSKYVLPIAYLPEFLGGLSEQHTILECGADRLSTHENTYFDTPGWKLYLDHHNGKLNRYKCRHRHYRETDVAYLKVKLKNNRDRTVKERISWPSDESIDWLRDAEPMVAALYVNYRRISLWNRDTNERMTVDFDLHFRRPLEANLVRLQEVFIVELKREGKMYGSPFVRRANGLE